MGPPLRARSTRREPPCSCTPMAPNSGTRPRVRDDASTLRDALQPTRLLPLDGIVRETALKATRGARGDEAKVRAAKEAELESPFEVDHVDATRARDFPEDGFYVREPPDSFATP